MDENNILETVKKLVGSDEYFNPDLLVAINAAISTLTQLGVGPKEGLIVDENSTWSMLTTDTMVLNLSKQYITLKTKLYFDISTASANYVETMKAQCSELEWRLNVAVDKSNTFS